MSEIIGEKNMIVMSEIVEEASGLIVQPKDEQKLQDNNLIDQSEEISPESEEGNADPLLLTQQNADENADELMIP